MFLLTGLKSSCVSLCMILAHRLLLGLQFLASQSWALPSAKDSTSSVSRHYAVPWFEQGLPDLTGEESQEMAGYDVRSTRG